MTTPVKHASRAQLSVQAREKKSGRRSAEPARLACYRLETRPSKQKDANDTF
jgi:hypothetical protein